MTGALPPHPFKDYYGNFIGGRWVDAADGRRFDNPSPITGATITTLARSSAADVEAALDAAHAAKDAWGRTSVGERSLILNRLPERFGRRGNPAAFFMAQAAEPPTVRPPIISPGKQQVP